MSRYRVIFTGLISSEDFFKDHITRLGISSHDTELMLNKAPVVLKEAESLEYIKKYADAIHRAGGKVHIQPCKPKGATATRHKSIPGMSSFTQCPQCGQRQYKNERCERCGFLLPITGKF